MHNLPVPAPAAPLLIVNPVAGDGRALHLEPWLHHRLRRAGPRARMIETRAPGHARELALHAAENGHDRVVAVGGDGTVQEIVNGIVDGGNGITVGILPSGNGNDLARSLGLPTRPEDALAIALDEPLRTIDLGRATRGDGATGTVRHFTSAGGIGFDAQVARAMAGRRNRWQRGRVGYALSTLWELQRFRNRGVELTVETPEGERTIERRILFMAFANGMFYGGGMQICPMAKLADGWLDLCLVGDISRLEAVRQLPGLYHGRHVGHPAVEFVRARSVTVNGETGTHAHLDGEPFGTIPMRIEVVPMALQVAAPVEATPGNARDTSAALGLPS
jgi:diacylglycerol kinase (ATP)